MAEPTCVIHPFSYTSPEFPNETHEENPMYGIGESVSFGRFMTDNLSWERWSSFNNNRNRYVEEAEKYSRKGSVAQKKAYFEAHFKRMAALKAAALLEEANNAAQNDLSQGHVEVSTVLSSNGNTEDGNVVQERVVNECKHKDGNFVVHQNELFSAGREDDQVLDHGKNVENVDRMVQDGPLDQDEICSVVGKDENCNASKEESSGIIHMEKPPLQRTSFKEEASSKLVKRNPPLSSYMPSIDGIGISKSSIFAPSPAKPAVTAVHPGKENYATPVKKKSSVDDPDKKRTPLRMSINRELNRIISPVIKKIGSSSKPSKDCSTPSKDSVNGLQEPPPPLTPSMGKRGGRSHLSSSGCDSKLPGPRWHILSTDGFKSPSNNRNKISSPIIPTSFCMSGDRATRRKQKLEDKFNATTTAKAPQPSKFKEKAEAELNKFRQSFCFKATSSPDHYGEIESQRSPSHKSESRRESPRRGRLPQTSTSQNKSSLPPRRPAVKLVGSKKFP